MKKYLCIGTDKVPPEWLPRWYEVPFDECLFDTTDDAFTLNQFGYKGLLVLKTIPNGDYKEHLKILKTERLLNGI